MAEPEVEAFLTDLAVDGRVAAATQNQALNAVLFLYRQVLHRELQALDAVRAWRPQRVPAVLSPDETARLLEAIDRLPTSEPHALMARLMYGAGLRLMECCRLRVKDVDPAHGQLTVREGKGDKDRYVMLPASLKPALEPQLAWRRTIHERDLTRGLGRVEMPTALERKYPAADHSLPKPSRPIPVLEIGRRLRHVALAGSSACF